MATEISELSIRNYRWTPSTWNGNEFSQILRWTDEGKLEPITTQQFANDMWKQYRASLGYVKEHNKTLASDWEDWQLRKGMGWSGWENPWPEGCFIKLENPKDVRARLLSTAPTLDWETIERTSPVAAQRKWPEHDSAGNPIFCEDLVDNGNCTCGKCF